MEDETGEFIVFPILLVVAWPYKIEESIWTRLSAFQGVYCGSNQPFFNFAKVSDCIIDIREGSNVVFQGLGPLSSISAYFHLVPAMRILGFKERYYYTLSW